jgi:hypothetical protein
MNDFVWLSSLLIAIDQRSLGRGLRAARTRLVIGVSVVIAGTTTYARPLLADPSQVSTATAASLPMSYAEAEQAGWTHVPGSGLFRPDCVHMVPQGAAISANGDVSVNNMLVEHYEACSEPPVFPPKQGNEIPAASGGYAVDIQYTPYMSSGDYINEVAGYWYAPGTPSVGNVGQNIFLWLSGGNVPVWKHHYMENVCRGS